MSGFTSLPTVTELEHGAAVDVVPVALEVPVGVTVTRPVVDDPDRNENPWFNAEVRYGTAKTKTPKTTRTTTTTAAVRCDLLGGA
jgi:hypothetical protein